ncbi:MAG: hypothetical protein PHS50_15260, partial [Kiritimatiellae bacterium]|nr:hypothetical protein [Kiritimatiellia bacterium]
MERRPTDYRTRNDYREYDGARKPVTIGTPSQTHHEAPANFPARFLEIAFFHKPHPNAESHPNQKPVLVYFSTYGRTGNATKGFSLYRLQHQRRADQHPSKQIGEYHSRNQNRRSGDVERRPTDYRTRNDYREYDGARKPVTISTPSQTHHEAPANFPARFLEIAFFHKPHPNAESHPNQKPVLV